MERATGEGFVHVRDTPGFDARPQYRSANPYAGGYMTKHGWFSDEDLRGAMAYVGPDGDGNRLIRFPDTYMGGSHPGYREIPDYKLAEGAAGGTSNDGA